MVSSYLICDVCGGFGPPASFLSEDGLRLCYQCWYQERYGSDLPAVDVEPGATGPEQPVSNPTEQLKTSLACPAQSRSSS